MSGTDQRPPEQAVIDTRFWVWGTRGRCCQRRVADCLVGGRLKKAGSPPPGISAHPAPVLSLSPPGRSGVSPCEGPWPGEPLCGASASPSQLPDSGVGRHTSFSNGTRRFVTQRVSQLGHPEPTKCSSQRPEGWAKSVIPDGGPGPTGALGVPVPRRRGCPWLVEGTQWELAAETATTEALASHGRRDRRSGGQVPGKDGG